MNVLSGPAFLFGTGLDEWAVLGAISFLLFGPKRLPEIARTIGRTLERFRRAADEFREQVAHLDDPPPAPSPTTPPPLSNPPPGAVPAAAASGGVEVRTDPATPGPSPAPPTPQPETPAPGPGGTERQVSGG